MLLEHGAVADKDVIESLLEKGTTSLHEAAKSGDIDQVKKLIAAGMNVNIQDDRQRLAIHYARDMGHSEIVDLLESEGVKGGGKGVSPRIQVFTGQARRSF